MFFVINQQLANRVAGRKGLPLANDFNGIAWGTSPNTPFDIVGENKIVGNAKSALTNERKIREELNAPRGLGRSGRLNSQADICIFARGTSNAKG
jgi:hypothetical protein